MANQKAREFVEQLSSQAGFDTQSEDFKNLLKDITLDGEIPEAVVSKIQESLLTRHAAKNDPEIAGHFKVKYYKTIDNGLKRSLKSAGYSDEQLAEIEAETDTLKKLETAIPKFADYIKSTFSSADEGGKKYQDAVKKYNDLQLQYENAVKEWQSKEVTWKSDLETREVNWELNNHLNSYQFSDTLPADDAKFIITNKFNSSPYIAKKVDGKLGVFQRENPDLVATKNNKSLTIKDVLDEIAAPYVKKAPTQQAAPPRRELNAGDGKPNQFSKHAGKNAAAYEAIKSQRLES